MDAGPGTDLGGLGWYLGFWVTMTAAMMLPSTVLFAPIVRGLPLLFAAGYLAAWTTFGIAAYGLVRLVSSLDAGWLAWDEGGPYAAGGVIVAAGVYELTPLKQLYLRRCRTPAPRSGLAYGLECIICCAGLMAVLFALGVMSILWMAVLAGVIFVEKVLPHGVTLTRGVALALVVLGLWVAGWPSSVPGLTEPDQSPSMQMGT